jgi:urease accessory protein
MTRRTGILTVAALAGTMLSLPAFAHTGIAPHEHGSFTAGFLHPLMGLDHLLAMLGIGIWAAQLGGRAVWLVPAAFVAVMAGGAALALADAPLPLMEFGIAGSVLAIGALVAFGTRLPVLAAMAVAAVFALFHGHAHGTELPTLAMPLAYGAGFVGATALLHVAGIGIAFAVRKRAAKLPLRVAGAAMAAIGGGLLLGA